jgi:hypothetical protein
MNSNHLKKISTNNTEVAKTQRRGSMVKRTSKYKNTGEGEGEGDAPQTPALSVSSQMIHIRRVEMFDVLTETLWLLHTFPLCQRVLKHKKSPATEERMQSYASSVLNEKK